MIYFEYDLVFAGDGLLGKEQLNAMGAEGWELCQAIPGFVSEEYPDGPLVLYIFKRQTKKKPVVDIPCPGQTKLTDFTDLPAAADGGGQT